MHELLNFKYILSLSIVCNNAGELMFLLDVH